MTVLTDKIILSLIEHTTTRMTTFIGTMNDNNALSKGVKEFFCHINTWKIQTTKSYKNNILNLYLARQTDKVNYKRI